jgi:hypothetical protein
LEPYTFAFQFAIRNEDLFTAATKLAAFDVEKFKKWSHGKWWEQEIALLVFVPVNDSNMADEVAKDTRKRPDFAHPMNVDTSVLMCRALPYSLSFAMYEDEPVLVQVN